jgi:putative tricarboxylic transport membrane protein
MRVAPGWIVPGIAIAVGGWRMDRLEQMHIEPWSAPGPVPGVLMSGSLTGDEATKGWLMGLLGLFFASIGLDPVHAHERFTFGWNELSGGINLIPAPVGAFGFTEILVVMSEPRARPILDTHDSALPRIGDVLVYWRTVLRSGVIGVFVGILPGVGEDMAAWSSYAAAKRASRERGQFGKGSVEGRMAAETGDNASIPGAIIPALALGVPGSAPAAVLMAAMIIHGVQPGPMLMTAQPQFVYDVVAITLVATLAILLFGLVMVRPIVQILPVPREIVMPIVFVPCVLGAYSIGQRLFDVYVMLAVGVVCFLLRRRGFPAAPFVLGLVLGDIVDKSLRRGLVLSDGSLLPFFRRPISAVLAAALRRVAEDHGLAICGLHWLLVAPKGCRSRRPTTRGAHAPSRRCAGWSRCARRSTASTWCTARPRSARSRLPRGSSRTAGGGRPRRSRAAGRSRSRPRR